MHCTRKITDSLTWVGANDRRLAMFEGVYSVPDGVSYNAYLLLDEQTVLFDTVDRAVTHQFLENVAETLGSRGLDYLIVQHMEPDHSAALTDLLARYPEATIVCNAKTLALIKQFFSFDIESRVRVVTENDALRTGNHTLRFLMAPMVHWPEVMMTYDATDKILFSADAFGCFGAPGAALFADEVDFGKDYMDEARRYYANIVGKYGSQVQAILNKASSYEIEMICPLHGFVWRKNFNELIDKYTLWSRYEPEDHGVMIAYASVYGNTANAAETLAFSLRERGIATVLFDVSVTPSSDIVAAAFRWSHLVFASTTYNAGIFVSMEALLHDLIAHNIQNRTVAIIENGSWAATSGGLIREKLSACKQMRILDDIISIRSSLKPEQLADIGAMSDALAATVDAVGRPLAQSPGAVDARAMFKLSYGLFVLAARDGDKDNACIINTAMQIAENPVRISVAVNKANYTHDMIAKTGAFTLSILTEAAPFQVFKHFGFQSGRNAEKFSANDTQTRAANGIRYVQEDTNGVISAKVSQSIDCGSHTLFISVVTESFVLSDAPSVTYQYYFDRIKPKPKPPRDGAKGFVCDICGYVYEGDSLPENFICPLCKHGAEAFRPA